MKVRESDMPDEGAWESFFKPYELINTMGIDHTISDVAEFGCGYGTFTVPAAKAIRGVIYALDIDPNMIKRVKEQAGRAGLSNVVARCRDFLNGGTGLDGESVDYVMLFNIIHAERPTEILDEAYRILKRGGKAGVIHWNYDPSTPRGPPMAIRPKPEQCIEWAVSSGFTLVVRHDLKPYHYGLVFSKVV